MLVQNFPWQLVESSFLSDKSLGGVAKSARSRAEPKADNKCRSQNLAGYYEPLSSLLASHLSVELLGAVGTRQGVRTSV